MACSTYNTVVITPAFFPSEEVGAKLEYLLFSASKHKMPLVPIGIGQPFDYFDSKVRRLLAWLKDECTTDYVACVDGTDVVVQGSFDMLCDRYNRLGHEVLLGGEVIPWPYVEHWHSYPQLDSPFRFPQCGFLMGTRQGLIKCLEQISNEAFVYDARYGSYDWRQNEQAAWHFMYLEKRISFGVDTKCDLVLNTYGMTVENNWHVTLDSAGIQVLITDRRPIFIHSPEDTWPQRGPFLQHIRLVQGW